MTETEKLAMVKAMTRETDESVLSTYLKIARDKVCRKAYPFTFATQNVPERYEYVQVEIAVYLINKRGAEGETAHSENGISRTYDNADIPSALLRDIVPFASTLGGDA